MMQYRAVGNRCAVSLNSLSLSISHEEVLAVLIRKGFRVVDVDMVLLARKCIGSSLYRRGAKPSEAPAVVDCSSFVKWLYGKRGICLPRRSIQQRNIGEVVYLDELTAGDIVFTSGWMDYYYNDPRDGVGHVGIATGEGTIIHASNKRVHIVETPLDRFVGEAKFRGARRYIPKGVEVLTFEVPVEREIETSDDIRWITLQAFSGDK